MFYLYYTVCTCIILGCSERKVLYELLKVMKRVTLLVHGISSDLIRRVLVKSLEVGTLTTPGQPALLSLKVNYLRKPPFKFKYMEVTLTKLVLKTWHVNRG